MKVEKFKEMFEGWTYTLDSVEEGLEKIVSNIVTECNRLSRYGFASVKIREELLSRELMLVRSDLVFIENGTSKPAAFTVSVQSTVDSLEDDNITYANFMNLTCREASKEDLATIYFAMNLHEKRPEINNLLNFYYRIGILDAEKQTKYRRGLLDASNCPLEEVGEVAIAI